MKMVYKGKDITKDMIIPLLNGEVYDIVVRIKPDRNHEGNLTYNPVAFVKDLNVQRTIACIPYNKNDWETNSKSNDYIGR